MMRFTGFSELADREGFLVAYPEGLNHRWNDGRQFEGASQTDDVAFIRTMLDRIEAEQKVNSKAVYVTGMSNGGFMASRLGDECADRFAAIAPVCGGIGPQQAPAARPISVLIMQGTADPLVPYAGGAVGAFLQSRGEVRPTDEAVAYWKKDDGCRGPGDHQRLPDVDPADGCQVERVHWSGRHGTAVDFYRIKGGGHTWPGGLQYLPVRSIGRVCRDIDATQVIWEFFRSHSRK
jgi:polyhydroxybutyrate depolymerase